MAKETGDQGGGAVRVALCMAGALTAVCLAGPSAIAEPVAVAPGDGITVEGGGDCTLGFLFTGSDRAAYMSTAGHCLLGTTETRKTWRAGAGPAVTTGAGQIGRLVFAEYLPAGEEDADHYDFALIRLDKGVRATAALPSFGAPTGLNDSLADEPAVLHTYGQGAVVSAASPGRDLLTTSLKRPDHVYAHGALAPGDSGAPVVDDDGRAVGTVLGAGGIPIRVGIGVPSVGHDGAANRIGRLKPVMSHAATALRVHLALVLTPRR